MLKTLETGLDLELDSLTALWKINKYLINLIRKMISSSKEIIVQLRGALASS